MSPNSSIRRVQWLLFSTSICAAMLSAQTSPNKSDETAYASIAVSEVSELREGVTLAQWMEMRGKREGWEFRKPDIDPLQYHPECLTEVKTGTLPSGVKIVRTMYFYPPSEPAPLVFPSANTAALLNTCTLAEIRVEVDAPTPQIGDRLDQAARKQFAAKYGANRGFSVREVGSCGVFYSENAVRWVRDAEVISGHRLKSTEEVEGPRFAFVRACLPIVRKVDRGGYSDGTKDPPLVVEQFHRAVSLAGEDASLSARLSSLYDRIWQQSDKRRDEDELPILREWIDALKTKAPRQRAAGLLAADRLLEIGRITGGPEGRIGGIQDSPLQRLGAVFEYSEPGAQYEYTRNWEKQARQLDPDGPVGQMAIIGLMDQFSCVPYEHDFFRQVIADGDALLRKGLDAATAARVHFMVGDAYAGIVMTAWGSGWPNGEYNPEEFRPEAGAARRKALEHYRAGLAVDKVSGNAKRAWRQAWHISAGLLPAARYMCGSD
jgi:hypothetical protein